MSPTATTAAIAVEPRYNGPLTSANGGYACGLVARHVDGPAEVTLRRPIPLATPLELERHDDGHVTLHDGETLLAEADPALPLDLEPPYRPTVAEAREAAETGFGALPDTFARCFVCATPHHRHDGLGVHFGPLPTHPGMTGAVLDTDVIAPELVWAALDCPSYTPELWHVAAAEPARAADRRAARARRAGRADGRRRAGRSRRDGRKHESATALLGADGRMLARARALWIELK